MDVTFDDLFAAGRQLAVGPSDCCSFDRRDYGDAIPEACVGSGHDSRVPNSSPRHAGLALAPRAGMIKEILQSGFQLEFYRERYVGPENYKAVTVQALAKRIS